MKSRKLLFCLFVCSLFMSACSKEVPVDNEVPKPEYLNITEVNFIVYGDAVSFTVGGTEAIQSVSDTDLVILPNREEFTTVSVEYIQGNSLNDFAEAYYSGLTNTTSDFVDGKFTTDTESYGFIKTDKNNYLLFKAPLHETEYLSELMGRFQE